MKAIRFHEFGEVDVLRYEEVERPIPGPGEVLVEVAATAFNPIDSWFRAGIIQQIFPLELPHVLGIDVAGTIIAVGEGVDAPAIEQAVIGLLPLTSPGAAAEFVVAPASNLTRAPVNVPLADAASIPVAALTAWQALREHGHIEAGQRVLINGAGGGVGGFTVQLAKEAGAFVIATASPRSVEMVSAFGADQIVDYSATTIAEAVTEPVDVVINLVAGSFEETEALLDLIKPGGVLVSATPPGGDFPKRDATVIFFSVRSDPAQLAQIVDRVESDRLRLDISDRRPLSETPRVHEQSEAGAIRGRVLLVPGS